MATQQELIETPVSKRKTIKHQSRTAVTFKGGLVKPAHRWFRLTPSFSPELVSNLIDEFAGKKENTKILDPFSGRGTTPIECQALGYRSVGVEINPVLHFAGRVSLDWSLSINDVKNTYALILAESDKAKTKYKNKNAHEIASILNVQFPQIHNVHRWWHDNVLRDLLILKASIEAKSDSTSIRDFFSLALTNILLDSANITLGRLQLHFIERSSKDIDPFELFKISANVMIDDLSQLRKIDVKYPSQIYNGDTRNIHDLVGKEKFNLVITSPPYPNRYSYVWNTRPHLFFLDMFDTAKQAGDLDCETIGGTWGTATSRHAKKPFVFTNEKVEDSVKSIVNEIREKDLLMSNYVAMYFDDMYRHIMELKKCLEPKAVCAYVVGNSRIKKSMVETDLLLEDIFLSCGFKKIRLEQIRKRNSGKELNETVVIVENE